jgi:DNA (cytosine-5)-methyltransferase 1
MIKASYSPEGVGTYNPKKPDGTQTYQQDRVYDIEGISPALSAELGGRMNILIQDYQSEYKDTWTKGELNGMKVNSFFCGAGGFDLGFIQAGFEITGAWDFDKYAVESYVHNIGMHGEQADVTQMKGLDIPKANGWLFGFPCQDISVAGKQKGMIQGETRSGLFYEIMRLLGEVADKPEWILAENVKAVKKFIPTIEEEYDKAGYDLVDPQLYNTKFWFLPQNRERYFLMGLRKDLNKSFTFPEQQTEFIPKLSSILESNVDEKYYIDDLKAAKIIEQAMEGLKVRQATKKGYDIAVEGDSINISHPNSQTRRGRVGKQVAQTLLTGTEQVVVMASRGRYNEEGKVEQNYELNKEGVSNTLTSVQKDNLLVEQPKIEMIGLLDMKGKDQWKRVYNPEGISPTLVCSGGGQHEPKILEQYRIRKLTPREYARLQGFPESYEQIVSNSQFYKQMGNAVSVTVSHAIAKAIKEQL